MTVWCGLELMYSEAKHCEGVFTSGVVKHPEICNGCDKTHPETSFFTVVFDSSGSGWTFCKNCSSMFVNFCIFFKKKIEGIENSQMYVTQLNEWVNTSIPNYLMELENDLILFDSNGLTLDGLELLRIYEELPESSGVYFFYNTVEENYSYIGSSKNIKERLKTHLGFSRKYNNGNSLLYFDFYRSPKKYRIGWILRGYDKEYWEYLCIDKFNPKFNILGKDIHGKTVFQDERRKQKNLGEKY